MLNYQRYSTILAQAHSHLGSQLFHSGDSPNFGPLSPLPVGWLPKFGTLPFSAFTSAGPLSGSLLIGESSPACEAKVRFRFRFIIVKHSRWIEIWHHLLITWGFLVDIPLDRVAGHVFWSWWETWSRPCSQPSARCASSGDDKGTPSNQGVHFQHATPPCRFKLTGNATISSVDHSDIWNSSPATPFAPWWMQGVPILPVFWCWMPPAILQSCTGCKKLPQFSVQVTLMHPAPHPEVAQWLNDCKLWRFGSKPAQKKLRNHWATISSSLFPSLALRTAS